MEKTTVEVPGETLMDGAINKGERRQGYSWQAETALLIKRRINAQRKAVGMTIKELSKRLDCQFERAKGLCGAPRRYTSTTPTHGVPTLPTLALVAEALGVSLMDLIPPRDEMLATWRGEATVRKDQEETLAEPTPGPEGPPLWVLTVTGMQMDTAGRFRPSRAKEIGEACLEEGADTVTFAREVSTITRG